MLVIRIKFDDFGLFRCLFLIRFSCCRLVLFLFGLEELLLLFKLVIKLLDRLLALLHLVRSFRNFFIFSITSGDIFLLTQHLV